MNHLVPEFDMDEDSSSSELSRPTKLAMPGNEIMELLWQNGQVIMQSQNQRSFKKSSPSKYDAVIPVEREIRPSAQGLEEATASEQHQNLFMHEDEMASWLHYPLHDSTFDQDFCTDLLYSAPPVSTTTSTAPSPNRTTTEVIASSTQTEPRVVQNFSLFSRQKARAETEVMARPSSSKSVVRESTVVDSSDTPGLRLECRVSKSARSTGGAPGGNNGAGTVSGGAVARTSSTGVGNGTMTCETTTTSSPDGSNASLEPCPKPPLPENRKRKGSEADDMECQNEDAEFVSANAKKHVCGSTSTKRSRAAEVHNLSERRRRDRINEKMKALQELIPRCNKSDKASMLDEAIEYLKSLQLQVQMMSIGYSMVPMMFPGVQQYMPPMGMGIGMSMELSMSRPMTPFPNVLSGSGLPTPASAAQLCPRYLMPSFCMPPVPAPDVSRIQATNQSDSMINTLEVQNANRPRIPNFGDPYQQYYGLQQVQLPPIQTRATAQPSTGKGYEHIENHQSGAGT